MKKSESRRKTLNKRGKLFVLSSPSGGGKTTLGLKLLKTLPRLTRSVSMTTRLPRAGEKNGADYFFVSTKQFLATKKKNGFLESANVFGHYYGTPRAFVDQKIRSGFDVLLLIDVQGAMQVKRAAGNCAVLIFVLPPSIKELQKRLAARSTETRLAMRARLKMAKTEIEAASRYDYLIENRDLSKALESLKCVIRAERLRN